MIDMYKLELNIRVDSEGDYAIVSTNGKEICWASILSGGSEPAYVERIDVDEEYRGHGIGTWTLRELAKHYDDIIIAADNADANRLYERLGFEYNGDSAAYIDQGYGVWRIR